MQAEWIVDLTTRADQEGKHAAYANRYDRSVLKVANLKELNMQIDRGYRMSAPVPACSASRGCEAAARQGGGLHRPGHAAACLQSAGLTGSGRDSRCRTSS